VGEGRTSGTRVSVYEAAEVMGVTVDAIRKRISRGTIPHERDDGGRVWVILDTDQDAASKVHDTDQPQSESGALISEMRERIQFLEDELQRKDAILLNMTEAMKALSPPQEEARESPESEVSPGPTEAPTEAQEGVQRPWWRRMFGG
jgi:excisionase family DNA binding protein